MSSTARAARYVRTWMADGVDLTVEDAALDRDGEPVPATLYRPARADRPLPSWVVLHGMTRPGRHHAQLSRFARALASTGAAVMVPEVPEWTSLRLAPHLTTPTVRAGLDGLRRREDVADAPSGIAGFSFGAPHAIAASGADGVAERCAGAVGFGGYADLETTIHFQITGHHRSPRRGLLHTEPDPYGRWIVAANYLTSIPGMDDRQDVANTLLELAREAGDLGIPSLDPRLDGLKAELRSRIRPSDLELFDLFLRGATTERERTFAAEMAKELADAARRRDPEIDALERFGTVRGPIHILHGRNDHLIPYTQAHRLGAALPEHVARQVTITRLFGHSAQDPFPWLEGPRETFRFFRALSRMLRVV